jgi:tRNA pseudouridine55 synthase
MNFRPLPTELKNGGLLLIDKPYKWTSFDAINYIKVTLKLKIGHCGTLDPLATGLLICCTGDMTKSIKDYQQLPKEYTGTICIGATTATCDLESEPEHFLSTAHITNEIILETALKFVGDIMQVPPAHSAVKIDGKRSYELAREGKEINLEARPVTIGEFEITDIQLPEISFRITCSTGTYIRSIARDFGNVLQCGAYLKSLRRTRIGNFTADNALTPNDWKIFWADYLPAKKQPK